MSLPDTLASVLPVPNTGALADRGRRRAALTLMAASGFAGLGYQIIWTQQSSVWLGHESAAVLAVVAAFFGGLALGALALGPRIERSRRPLRWYVGCEVLIAVWGSLLALLIGPAGSALLVATGVQPSPVWQWTVAFLGMLLLLLPATAAMGATLPAMERLFAPLRCAQRSIAALYAANTTGAVLGVLASAFWLVPELGLARSAALCIALNLLCAGLALMAFSDTSAGAAMPPASAAAPYPQPHPPPSAGAASARRAALARLALSGLLGIGYEVLVVRVLSQVSEDTVYTFAALLAVYLVGTAAGAAAYQRWRGGREPWLAEHLPGLLAFVCLLGSASLWAAEQFKAAALAGLGSSMAAAVSAEALLAVAAFGLPTLLMGALFSQLSAAASAAGVSFGRALGINTLGAAAAPLLFGVLLTPLLGPKATLLLIPLGYLALAAPRNWRQPQVWLPAGLAAAVAVWAPALVFVDLPEGARLVSYQEGAMAAVSVVEDAQGVSRLRINNRQQEGSSASLLFDGRQAVLPLLLHPAPQRALFLGLGTGMTVSAAAEDPGLQVDAVELLPEVISASAHFTQAFGQGEPNPRLHLLAADARRFVRTTAQHYDVIVADNFHPARSGSGALYTVQHFEAVRQRLAPGGLFCQWLPLHQLDLDTLRSIVQSFLRAYPEGQAMLANNSLLTPVLGLVGSTAALRFEPSAVANRLAHSQPAGSTARFGFHDEWAVLGSFVAGPASLRHFAGAAEANTDDRPVVAYRAPRITYAPDSRPSDRLMALLQALAVTPGDLLAAPVDVDRARRLSAYLAARQRFIAAGQEVRPTADVQQLLAQVQAPLLATLALSPDFRPAYDPLLGMARALARNDAAAARRLLTALVQAQPARPEAGLALRALVEAPP